MRKFAPAFPEAFQFNATDAGDELKDAVALLRDRNQTGKRKLPGLRGRLIHRCPLLPSIGRR